MRVLVTGGAGFVGSHLADRFLREGYEVRVLDNLDGRVHPHGIPQYLLSEAEFIDGSVTDRRCWERALVGVDVVSHQAAYQDYMLDFSKFIEVNALGTTLLYEVLVEKHLSPWKVIVASSQAVYGEGQYRCSDHGLFLPAARSREQLQRGDWCVYCPSCRRPATQQPLSEEHTNPVNQYAVSKFAGERIALGLGTLHRIPTVALRYSITQGPRQSLFNQYSGILRIFLGRILNGLAPIIYEDGYQTRDFVHVNDVVEANFKVLQSANAEFEAFNVGSGKATTALDYAHLLLAKTKSGISPEVPGCYRVGDNRHSVSSIDKLKKLGWSPRYDLDQIISDFLAWVEENGDLPTGVPDGHSSMCVAGVVQSVRGGHPA